MKIRITAGDWGGDYEADSGRKAIQLFFEDVMANKIKLCQLSPIGEWTDGKEKIPFRIAPALFSVGKMTAQELVGTLRACDLDFEAEEIMSMVKADSWMVKSK